MATSMSFDAAVGAGDCKTVEHLLNSGADPNCRSKDGMTPLAVASFWGYDTIVQLLLQHGADVNTCNKGTLWTPLHCAAFQGHGKVVMILLENKADFDQKDSLGRTAVDFASALDSIWAFFAACGCERTPKNRLIKLRISTKFLKEDNLLDEQNLLQFSQDDQFKKSYPNEQQMTALSMGDVLAGLDDEAHCYNQSNKPFSIWNS